MSPDLPQGFVNLGKVSLHEADVEPHTIDLERFKAMLPSARNFMVTEGDELPQLARKFAEGRAETRLGKILLHDAKSIDRLEDLQLTGIELALLLVRLTYTLSTTTAVPVPPVPDSKH